MTSLIPALLDGPALDRALADVAEETEHAVSGADAVGAVVHRGPEVLRASSAALAATVDTAQYGLGQGPCLHAYRTGRLVLLDLDDHDRRWPLFQEAAVAAGAYTVLSVPLRLDDRAIGSLNLYSRDRGAFDARVAHQAELFARPCALRLALVGVAVHAVDAAEVAALELQDRDTIERALGVLMGIHRDESVPRARRRLGRAATELQVSVLQAAGRILAAALSRGA